MNYKRQKPRKQARYTYYDNDRIGNSGRKKDLEDEWPSIPAKYPSWYCKKRKEKHEFLFVGEEEFSILPGRLQTFQCSSCGKKKIKLIDSNTIGQLAN